MKPAGILETVLYAVDLGAIERFYRDVLGLEPHSRAEGRQVFYRLGEQMLLIFNPDVTERPPANARASRAPARHLWRGSRLLSRLG